MNFYVDISDYLEQKLHALSLHRSQMCDPIHHSSVQNGIHGAFARSEISVAARRAACPGRSCRAGSRQRSYRHRGRGRACAHDRRALRRLKRFAPRWMVSTRATTSARLSILIRWPRYTPLRSRRAGGGRAGCGGAGFRECKDDTGEHPARYRGRSRHGPRATCRFGCGAWARRIPPPLCDGTEVPR